MSGVGRALAASQMKINSAVSRCTEHCCPTPGLRNHLGPGFSVSSIYSLNLSVPENYEFT